MNESNRGFGDSLIDLRNSGSMPRFFWQTDSGVSTQEGWSVSDLMQVFCRSDDIDIATALAVMSRTCPELATTFASVLAPVVPCLEQAINRDMRATGSSDRLSFTS